GARRDRLLDRARPAPLHAAGEGRRAPVGIAGPTPRARDAGDGPLMSSFTATLRRHVAAHPDKTALVVDRVRLSYPDLDRLADCVAAGLAARGIRAGEVVSSVLPNRAEAAGRSHAARRLRAA